MFSPWNRVREWIAGLGLTGRAAVSIAGACQVSLDHLNSVIWNLVLLFEINYKNEANRNAIFF
jgi:hypothetical protein